MRKVAFSGFPKWFLVSLIGQTKRMLGSKSDFKMPLLPLPLGYYFRHKQEAGRTGSQKQIQKNSLQIQKSSSGPHARSEAKGRGILEMATWVVVLVIEKYGHKIYRPIHLLSILTGFVSACLR